MAMEQELSIVYSAGIVIDFMTNITALTIFLLPWTVLLMHAQCFGYTVAYPTLSLNFFIVAI